MGTFTDQKPRIATEEDCKRPWSGRPNGEGFRCYLCGHRFKPGDQWRWVYANGQSPAYGNFLVCKKCDGDDVLDRWQEQNAALNDKYWWLQGGCQ